MHIEKIKVKLNLHYMEQGPNEGKGKKMLSRAETNEYVRSDILLHHWKKSLACLS